MSLVIWFIRLGVLSSDLWSTLRRNSAGAWDLSEKARKSTSLPPAKGSKGELSIGKDATSQAPKPGRWGDRTRLSVCFSVTIMTSRVNGRNCVNSAEQATEAGTQAGPGQEGAGARLPLAFSLLPALPHPARTSFSCRSLWILSKESGRWLLLFLYQREQNRGYFSLNASKLCQVLGACRVLEARTPAVSPGLCWWLPSVLKAELRALWVPWSHRRDFCSEESRCDDNHCHLKSSEA